MPDTTGSERRAYRSEVREAQARATRRAVVTAAVDLFVERGYAATTIDAVAERAGVSRKTVFASVAGGKSMLLKLAWDWAIAGDDEPVPMMQRPEVRRMQAQTDPRVIVRLQAERIAEVSGRLAAIGRVVTAAADVDPEVAELKRTTDGQRLVGATMFVRWLDEHGWLRKGVDADWATETAWVLMDSAIYGRFVDERGWSARKYEQWVCEMLTLSLLEVTAP